MHIPFHSVRFHSIANWSWCTQFTNQTITVLGNPLRMKLFQPKIRWSWCRSCSVCLFVILCVCYTLIQFFVWCHRSASNQDFYSGITENHLMVSNLDYIAANKTRLWARVCVSHCVCGIYGTFGWLKCHEKTSMNMLDEKWNEEKNGSTKIV